MTIPRRHRGHVRRLAALAIGLLAVLIALAPGSALPTSAQEAAWTPVGIQRAFLRIHSSPRGHYWAVSQAGLFWSPTGQGPWQPTRLPPPRSAAYDRLDFTFDPSNQNVLYATGNAGLYKSDNAGATWRPIHQTGDHVLAVAVSPIQPSLVYLVLANPTKTTVRWLRSDNAGERWTVLGENPATMCGWVVPVVTPHPTDANRVFRSQACRSGRAQSGPIEESRDRGQSWSTVLTPSTAFVERVSGGRGGGANVFYAAANVDPRARGPIFYRSTDGGRSWQEARVFAGGTGDASLPANSNVQVGGVAADPNIPTRVWAGFRQGAQGVQISRDGGLTWVSFGPRSIGNVNDLTISADGRFLYAATDTNIWRTPLPQS